MRAKMFLRKLFQYFLQGVIIVAPIAITVWAVTALFNSVDNILPSLIDRLFPSLFGPRPTKENSRPGIYCCNTDSHWYRIYFIFVHL